MNLTYEMCSAHATKKNVYKYIIIYIKINNFFFFVSCCTTKRRIYSRHEGTKVNCIKCKTFPNLTKINVFMIIIIINKTYFINILFMNITQTPDEFRNAYGFLKKP